MNVAVYMGRTNPGRSAAVRGGAASLTVTNAGGLSQRPHTRHLGPAQGAAGPGYSALTLERLLLPPHVFSRVFILLRR